MENNCPNAWLLDFANPVAVLSGMVNRHTKIKALGICGGFLNHQWDLSRIMGRDEGCPDYDVSVAGINHLSFIVEGFVRGRDLFAELDRILAGDWKMPELQPYWAAWQKANIQRSVTNLIRFYRELGVLIFSTEGDGMMHLHYEENVACNIANGIPSPEEIEARLASEGKKRAETNRWFESHATQDLDDAFWAKQGPASDFAASKDDVFIRALRGIAGVEPAKIVTSRLNHGAIEGFPDDAVVEYSQVLYKDRIRASGRFKVPDIVHGLISGIAVHQTMLGDACATGDPKLLAHALLAYPVRPYSAQSKALYRELIDINRKEIPESLRRADDYLK
jgi:alpha-galactosidase/6-phospho-beta-glucosidase family protein